MVAALPEFAKTIEHIREIYGRRYTVTLAPTPENIGRALALYARAVETHQTLYSIIISTYGYRYRRMENFIRELGLWKAGEGWLHPKVYVKIYFDYFGKRENTFEIEITFEELVPEHLVSKVDWEHVEALVYDIIDSLGWEWTMYIGTLNTDKTSFNIGVDEEIEWEYTYCCNQTIDVKAVLWKYKHERWKIYDTADFEIDLANYILHGVKVCEEEEDWVIT